MDKLRFIRWLESKSENIVFYPKFMPAIVKSIARKVAVSLIYWGFNKLKDIILELF